MNWNRLSDRDREWIEAYCNQTISAEAFAAFEAALAESPGLRAATRHYLALDSNLRQGSESLAEAATAWDAPEDSKGARFPVWVGMAAAAAVAFLVGLLATKALSLVTESAEDPSLANKEVMANGYAVVHGVVGAVRQDEQSIRSGDILGAETLVLSEGSARIDFFSGAQVYLEGPAELEIRSAWAAAIHSGKLRAKVPTAARGFTIESNGRRIVDLGTEFGVDANDDEVKVEVFSGEIELEDRTLVQGEAVSLTPDGRTTSIRPGIGGFSGLFSILDGVNASHRLSFQEWLRHSDATRRDERLIAYFPFISKSENAPDIVPSHLFPLDEERDGAAILAEWVDGRWGSLKGAMEFRRPGSRVRVNVPGEFQAYTFSCWARIDSLDRRYNALFLADSYQTGEPHWQVRNDGKLMIGVMVDDQAPEPADRLETFPWAGLSRNYYSPSFWDMRKSGQWVHLVSVLDPANRRAAHYVDGELLSEHEIEDAYVPVKLAIGNAEIGNWGDPNRNDPAYGIRNLNGRIDELAIYDAALESSEIQALYHKGLSH